MTWTPTPPAGTIPYNSQTYQLVVASATGGDMVYSWSINGRAGAGGATGTPTLSSSTATPPYWPAPGTAGASFIYPWQNEDITIRGIELTIIPAGPGAATPAYTFLMSGNNAWGDTQIFMPAGQLNKTQMFPDGGFQFPGWANMGPMTYCDLHGSCTAGAVANVMYTFYYSVNPSS
jgi:hypothetical protein